MRHRHSVLAALLAAALSGMVAAQGSAPANTDALAVAAGDYKVEPLHTRVQFTVSHMGFTDWYGDLTDARGTLRIDPRNIAAAALDVRIPTASVSTTNTTLDGELRGSQWLDAERFPEMRFVSTKVVRKGQRDAAIAGNLTFHGTTRPVVLKARFNGAGINPLDKSYTVGFNGTMTIRRSDFGLNTYVPLIGDSTELRISAAFVRSGA
jgi:polyisoprenoid-binding protein YceI